MVSGWYPAADNGLVVKVHLKYFGFCQVEQRARTHRMSLAFQRSLRFAVDEDTRVDLLHLTSYVHRVSRGACARFVLAKTWVDELFLKVYVGLCQGARYTNYT